MCHRRHSTAAIVYKDSVFLAAGLGTSKKHADGDHNTDKVLKWDLTADTWWECEEPLTLAVYGCSCVLLLL